jgi:hypothetical protein
MGWLFSTGWHTKADLVKHLTDENGLATIAKSVRGNVLWTVHEIKPDANGNVKRFIGCYLLSGGRDMGWGYKDMDESMGPCNYDCPLKFFDMVPDPGGYATAWRESVRAFHASKAVKAAVRKGIVIGSRIVLTEGCTILGKPVTEHLIVSNIKPLVGRLGWMDVRILPRSIAQVLPPLPLASSEVFHPSP